MLFHMVEIMTLLSPYKLLKNLPNTLKEAKVRQQIKNFKILILYLGYNGGGG
jgi:hypothetical protein